MTHSMPRSCLHPEEPVPVRKDEVVKPFTYENIETPPGEKLAIVCLPHVSGLESDRLGLVDLDESSSNFLKVISTVKLGCGQEPGRINWTRSASNATDDVLFAFYPETATQFQVHRTHVVVPCMNTNRIQVVSIEGRSMRVVKVIEGECLERKDLSCPYAVRTLPLKGAPVHISVMGDRDGHGKGDFVLLDRHQFNLRDRPPRKTFAGFGGDFAFQARHNVTMTTEWGPPRIFRRGFTTSEIENVAETFGNKLHIWRISPPELLQTIELDDDEGCLVTTVRFLHNPETNHAFACTAIGSSIYHIFMESVSAQWAAQKVAQIPPIPVKNWESSEVPALLTDLVISFDDKWLFVAGWLHGIVWRFDISDPFRVSLHSSLALGGLFAAEKSITPSTEGMFCSLVPTVIGDVVYRGGPAILQLSRDGRRLYVSNSFYKSWDAQFFPDLVSEGGQIVRVDISTSGLELNKKFIFDFSVAISGGPFVPRDLHFLEGDCTSDNFL